eukprot:TRINITY_DN1816_c0_g1_i1.p1 TRINITY_DN1816_c0_g1~~TRINITY_DN1816_c0_g1_i1.p1  ORF type:complete len:61 (+),score=9.95 TRINITY_DN1816_c0_g1_i1:145-327(+)
MTNPEHPEWFGYALAAIAIKYNHAYCFKEPWNKKYAPDYKTTTMKEFISQIRSRDIKAKL